MDVIDACIAAWDGGSLRDLKARIDALSAFRQTPDYLPLASAFKRAQNITKDTANVKRNNALLIEDAEKQLAAVFDSAQSEISATYADGDYTRALSIVARQLKAPIDRFFEDVFVMSDDEAVRKNRLALLREIVESVNRIAHFQYLPT
ncbi:MAG: DALR anticodon-binding domain-containing protein [Polyangiales bacterium]